MVRKRNWQPPPPISIYEMLLNSIKHSYAPYKGGDYETTLEDLYLGLYGEKKEVINGELSKWIDINGVDIETPITLPERFFQQ